MDKRTDSEWMKEKMALLEPASEWRPDPGHGLERMHARETAHKRRKRSWVWSAGMVSAAFFLMLAISASQSCAWGACLVSGNLSLLPASIGTQHDASFKTSGSAAAPITVEIYSDYECPFCAKYFEGTVPLILSEFVQTGKVKLIHRDFPLPQHTWARVAARYANAAGELGQYDTAVGQIFRTQDLWRENGNIDAQLTHVLPPGVMQKVREKVQHEGQLDDSLAADFEMARKDHIDQTPSLVIESKGKRETLPAPSWPVLKSYLEQLLRR